MPDTLSFAEIDGQHVELLPSRTVVSLFSIDGGDDTVIGRETCVATPAYNGLLGTGIGGRPASIVCTSPPGN